MPKFKRLSGKEIIKILQKYGFVLVSQKGSHVKLRRIASNNIKETLTIPNHKELDTGTLKAILNQASKYINQDDLLNDFTNSNISYL